MDNNQIMAQIAKDALNSTPETPTEDTDEVVIGVGSKTGKVEEDVTKDEVFASSTEDLKETLNDFVKEQQEENDRQIDDVNIEITDPEILEKRKIAQEHPDWSIDQIDAEYLKSNTPSKYNEDGIITDQNIDVVVVKIDKTNQDSIAFTEEEQRKLSISKSIRLVPVEDKSLSTIKIKKAKPKEKTKFMKNLDLAISRTGVPLPVFGDFSIFKGAQSVTLATNILNDDDTLSESLSKKTSLLYECFCGGTELEKYDDNKSIVLTINEFADLFPYPDISMGIYAILCASTKATGITDLQCNSCKNSFKHEYRVKNFLHFDNIPDKWKERIDKILQFKGNPIEIKKLVEEGQKAERIRSTETGNIYDLVVPSIGKAKAIFDQIDENDPQSAYYASILLYLENVYIPDMDCFNEEVEYISLGRDIEIEKSRETKIKSKIAFTDEEAAYNPIKELFEVLQELPEIDLRLLANRIAEMYVEPTFAINTKCPHCGKDLTVPLDLQHMLFLVAQASSTEIE